jgi:hypothetical protein
MLVKLNGIIEELGQTVQITDKLRKRDIVLKTGTGQYPDYLKCEAINERIGPTEALRVGDYATLNVAIGGRKVTKKDTGENLYFTSLKVLAVETEPLGEHSLRNIEQPPF